LLLVVASLSILDCNVLSLDNLVAASASILDFMYYH